MVSKKIKLILSNYLIALSLYTHSTKTPQITVIIVIDQFAYSYLYKIKPYLTGGIKTFLDDGISYENAHHPHAMPETAVGHAALNTGTFANDHGIIANSWFNQSGREIEADDDDAQAAGVFKNESEMHAYGKGPKLLMTEGITDQFVLQSKPEAPYLAFAFSIKSRAAIMSASKLGKAIWFDKKTGLFTSSKAYYQTFPSWLIKFNKSHNVPTMKSISWKLALNKKTGAYNFQNIENYTYASEKESMVGKTMPIPCCSLSTQANQHTSDIEQEENPTNKDPYASFYLNPLSNQYLLDLAKNCIKENLTKKNHLLIWVSLSSLDLIGHRYGPDSLEAIDTVYHIDKQLKPFMHYVQQAAGNNGALFVLTADHGVLPMQGILRLEGISSAHKLDPQTLIDGMNKLVLGGHGLKDFITHFQMPHFYFNRKLIQDIDTQTLDSIIKELKKFLHGTAGIKNVWTAHDLDTFSFDPLRQELETYYKNQRYPGRSGDLFVQLQPYALLSKYKEGTTHESPYNYDTHVPLIIYQPNVYKQTSIIEKVYATQLANTLAQILDIRKPPASTAQVLPGIFDSCNQKSKSNFKKSLVTVAPSVIKKQQALGLH